jgi:hypothetical protein
MNSQLHLSDLGFKEIFDLIEQAGFIILDRKQLSEFLHHNERNLLDMFCQQRPPTKRWIETKGEYWQGWQDCNNKVKETLKYACL